MIQGYRVVAVIPAGRERTMSLLMKYLDREHRSGLLDEVQVWTNTRDERDLAYLESLSSAYGFVDLKPPASDWLEPKQRNTGTFYQYTRDHGTIYVRFDDDIVYLHEDALRNLLEFRLKHQEYFLVFPTIWNNAVVSWIEQHKVGAIDESHGTTYEPYCMDPIGWGSPEFGEHVHRILLGHIEKDTVPELYFDRWELKDAHRFSISSFAFFGRVIDELWPPLPEMPDGDEEIWFTELLPRRYGWLNVVMGSAVVSHFTFYTQRAHILKTDILDQYRDVAFRKHSQGYYAGLPST